MATVRVQARGLKGNWNTVAQLERADASAYIDCMRSNHFLETVEKHMRTTLEERVRAGKLTALPDKIEAVHLRTIRVDDSAFRIVPAWAPNTSINEDLKLQESANDADFPRVA